MERPFDNLCPRLAAVSFFLARLYSYPNWIEVLIASKGVNVVWVREVCASLIKDTELLYTYFACMRGQELDISPIVVANAFRISVVDNQFILN